MRTTAPYRNSILYHTVISLAVICFASPLFQVLGFEYSSLIALASSIWVMLLASKRVIGLTDISLAVVLRVFSEALAYSGIPLVISFLSLIVIPNCALLDGLVFYIEIVPLTILIGVLLGIAVGITAPTNRLRILLVVSSWLLWLMVSLLPGYFGPQIFTYGWQYGYFPGFVWDEVIELQSAYWWSRFIILAVSIYPLLLKRAVRSIAATIGVVVLPLWVAMLIFELFPHLGISHTTGYVEEELSKAVQVQNAVLHYSPDSLQPDEVTFISYEIGTDLDSIRAFYHLPINSFGTIDIYLYPSVAELYKYIGTRSASISKPWRSELHIAKENLQSLKHELVHVLLAPKGSFPFRISYSTGITEGAAESIEETYDGLRSLNHLSSEILELKLASGVSDVLGFTGFASNASSKSYVLAGAFSSYLISKYGADNYLQVYSSLDYEGIYHKSLKDLEADWLADSKQHPVLMSADDSLRTNYFYARRSIIMQPCLRRIGKLMKEARGFFHDRQYEEADSIYAMVAAEAGRADAIQGRVYSLLRLHKVKEALAILDTAPSATDLKNQTGLHILRGDVLFLNEDYARAAEQWQQAARLKLNAEHFLAAYSRLHCFAMAEKMDVSRLYFTQLYDGASSSTLNRILGKLGQASQQCNTTDSFLAEKKYLMARNDESLGELKNAMHHLELSLQSIQNDTGKDEDAALFYRLMLKRYNTYRACWKQ
ncbi:MAG TPA: hypothetical protein VFO76_03440 [Candidatus Kapabacteria bacterium]|nr:hypothetical protein [Candidatus Kapabacteria bacterium]